MFESIVGQEHARSFLTRLASLGRLQGSFLFHGPPDVGKRMVADILVRRVNCDSPAFVDDCGCGPCSRIRTGDYLDYIALAPDDNGRIAIGEVREAIKFLSYKARERRWKTLIIESCDSLTFDAADVLLKLLEEPYPKTLILLTCSNLHRVKDTVRSRCMLIRFSFLNLPDLRRLAGPSYDDQQLYLMGGGFNPSVASTDLFYFGCAFNGELNNSDPESLNKEALLQEMRFLLLRFTHAARVDLVKIGRRSFGFVDAERIAGAVVALEAGIDNLRMGVTPYLVLRSAESTLIRAFGR